MNPFVESNFPRHANDHYPTIDGRCLDALLEAWDVPSGRLYDACVGENGESGLVDQRPDLFTDDFSNAQAIVTNPPYKRGLVDLVVSALVGHVQSDPKIIMAACLLRTQWDHAKGRSHLFDSEPFAGLVRLRFRPWWSEDRSKTPIHSYQWVIWDRRHSGEPVVRYWPKEV